MQKITIVTGPTCSGKTAKAIELATQIDAEIISCDSVQIYADMNIGSAKADEQERGKIPHHLIDVALPNENFDVAKYVELAKTALADISKRGKNVVVAGGSGFYLKSWYFAVADNIQIPQNVKDFADEYERKSSDSLAKELLRIDPQAAEFLDIKNPRRVKNALMRCMASGLSVSELRRQFAEYTSPFGELEKETVFLNPPDEIIKAKIEKRTMQMLENGLLHETETLLKKYSPLAPSAAAAIGYRETIDFLVNNKTDERELADLINRNTFALVKKQRKFFKSQLNLI